MVLLWKWKTNKKCLSYSLLSGMKLQIHRSSIKWFFLDIVAGRKIKIYFDILGFYFLLLLQWIIISHLLKISNFTSQKNSSNLGLKSSRKSIRFWIKWPYSSSFFHQMSWKQVEIPLIYHFSEECWCRNIHLPFTCSLSPSCWRSWPCNSISVPCFWPQYSRTEK